MPTTFYTEEEFAEACSERDHARRKVEALEALRPVWAFGFSSDSEAAQVSTAALVGLWGMLGATDQTQAVIALRSVLEHAKR